LFKALQKTAEPALPLWDREKSVREVLLFSGMEAKMKKKGIDRVLFPLATAILLGLFSGQAFANGQTGNAATEGRWQQEGNNWKYLDASGQEKTGWVESKGQWYYVDPQSKNLKTGWMEKDGKWF